jgi:tryptophanase
LKTIIEPFRIKMVEPIKMTTLEERIEAIETAGFNPFMLPAAKCLIDLLTDSGTSAMSTDQWAAMIKGDESYAGARSWFKFESAVKKVTGFKHVIPAHQGRAAERLLFSVIAAEGMVVPSNTHFDTTRANIEFRKASAVDFVVPGGEDPEVIADFKGNMDIVALENCIRENGPEKIPVVMLTVTNNATGGQPVSMANIKATRAVCDKYGLPLFLDVARFAENAWFIKVREPGYADKSLREISLEMFSLADGCTMSAKKDALVNIGGFIALNNDELAVKLKNLLILTEGYTTYGGLAGRDLEAIAQGLEEILDEDYMRYRIRTVEYLAEKLNEKGIPIFNPPGGHAVYLDARRFLPHLPAEQFPGQALVTELYIEGGVRSVEIGSVMFGYWDASGKFVGAPNELVRLALPRRVYTQSHIDYLIEVVEEVYARRDSVRGLKFKYEAPILRHFSSTFERV